MLVASGWLYLVSLPLGTPLELLLQVVARVVGRPINDASLIEMLFVILEFFLSLVSLTLWLLEDRHFWLSKFALFKLLLRSLIELLVANIRVDQKALTHLSNFLLNLLIAVQLRVRNE